MKMGFHSGFFVCVKRRLLDFYVPLTKKLKYPYFRILKEAEISLGEVSLSICYSNHTLKIIFLYKSGIKKHFPFDARHMFIFRNVAVEALRSSVFSVVCFCFLPIPS